MLTQFNLVPTKSKAVSVGDVFGRLTVVEVGQIEGTYRYMAICQCSCGSELKAIRQDLLKDGRTLSCGCLHKEAITKHGLTKSGHYSRWRLMIDRCENPECESYKSYGGRGIKVCERWHDISAFVEDLPDGYFQGAEIDRIDNDGDYEPGNVRWANRSQNCDNRRTGNKIAFNGETKSLQRWAESLGLNEATLRDRLYVSNWPIEKALSTPAMTASESGKIGLKSRWAGHKKKQKPAPRITKTIEYNGRQVSIAELAEITGISKDLLRKRIFERNWPVEKAVK